MADRCSRFGDTFFRKGFSRRSVETALKQTRDSNGALTAVLGAVDLTMFGVGAIIGAGVFVLTGEAAKEFSGPSIIISYCISSVAAILLALSYVEFGVDLPVTGGAFNYVRLVQGEFLAWQVGSSLVLEYMLGSAAVSKGFSGYLASLFGLGTSTFVASASVFDVDAFAFCLITALALLLYTGTKQSASFNILATGTNIFVILFILCAAVGKADPDHFSPFLPNGTQNMFRAAAVVFFSYIGFDTLVTVAAEVKNPRRDLPIGVVGSISISAVLYTLMAAALIGLQAYDEIDATAPFSEAFVSVGMRWAGRIVSLGALTGIVTSVLVNLLGISRVFVVLGREKLLPPWIAAIDENHSTPKHALLVSWVGSGLLALLFDIDILARAVSMGTLFSLCLVSLASIQRTYTDPSDVSLISWPLFVRLLILISAAIVEGAAFALEVHPAVYGISLGVVLLAAVSLSQLPVKYVPQNFVTPLKPFTPSAAVLAAIHLMFSLGWEAHVLFLVWQIIAFLIYFLYGMHYTDEPVDEPKQVQLQPRNDRQGSGLLQGIQERSDVVSVSL